MKFPFFASVLIFLLVLHHNLTKSKKIGKKQEDSFWKKEYDANSARKQSLGDLTFISFSAEDFFPLTLLPADKVGDFLSAFPQVKEILPRLLQLSEAKIVNLSTYSNTDLKFKYGIANFNLLSSYDENYITLVSLLHQYGLCYYEAGHKEAALKIFSYAIFVGSDVSEAYVLALKLCQTLKEDSLSDRILEQAAALPENRKHIIFRKLKESGLFVG